MLLGDDQAPAVMLVGGDDPEALIREARRRTRRRRVARAFAVLVAAGVALGLYVSLVAARSGVIAETATTPFANVRAFNRHGELAFVSRGQLWVLDGTHGTLRHVQVAAGREAVSPTFSHDGRWLAYVVQRTNLDYDGPSQLWIAHAGGAGPHRVPGVALNQLVGWNPHSDVLAATVGQELRHAPYLSATALKLVTPDGRQRTLVAAPARPRALGGLDAIGGAVWSPGGARLAVVLQGGSASTIETVPVGLGARPTVWLAIRGSQRVRIAGMSGRVPSEVIPELTGWWSRWGVAFWVIDFGAVHNLDSTPLAVIPRPGAQPRLVAETLSAGITDAVTPGPGGTLALVASFASAGRDFGLGKTVETCNATTGKCSPVPAATTWSGSDAMLCSLNRAGTAEHLALCLGHRDPPGRPGSGVSEDPSWSPNGQSLAYVKAPVADTDGWPSNAWIADHAVYVWNSRTGEARRLGTVDGAALPTWSGDAHDLLYERDDGLWLVPVATGRPTEIVRPLYPETAWNEPSGHLSSISFYGQIPWRHQFSWWSPPGTRGSAGQSR